MRRAKNLTPMPHRHRRGFDEMKRKKKQSETTIADVQLDDGCRFQERAKRHGDEQRWCRKDNDDEKRKMNGTKR